MYIWALVRVLRAVRCRAAVELINVIVRYAVQQCTALYRFAKSVSRALSSAGEISMNQKLTPLRRIARHGCCILHGDGGDPIPASGASFLRSCSWCYAGLRVRRHTFATSLVGSFISCLRRCRLRCCCIITSFLLHSKLRSDRR